MSNATIEDELPLVLVVDDDEATRTLLRRVMEHDGYRVAEAVDGRQAVTAYIALHPDIVLLDAIMPGMEGFDACAELRTAPGGERTPVLMITSLDDKASIDRAFAAGASDYVTKPFNWPGLRERVRNLLDRSAV